MSLSHIGGRGVQRTQYPFGSAIVGQAVPDEPDVRMSSVSAKASGLVSCSRPERISKKSNIACDNRCAVIAIGCT